MESKTNGRHTAGGRSTIVERYELTTACSLVNPQDGEKGMIEDSGYCILMAAAKKSCMLELGGLEPDIVRLRSWAAIGIRRSRTVRMGDGP